MLDWTIGPFSRPDITNVDVAWHSLGAALELREAQSDEQIETRGVQ